MLKSGSGPKRYGRVQSYPSIDQWRRCLEPQIAARPDLAGSRVSVTRLDTPEAVPDGIVASDGVGKLLIRDGRGRPFAVALCASPVSPKLVARGVSRARQIKMALGTDLGRCILDPVLETELEGLSCAVYPYCRPLSRIRVVRKIQKLAIRPAVLKWLAGAASTTMIRSAEVREVFLDRLGLIASEDGIPSTLRNAAAKAIGRTRDGSFDPCHVVSHNDLWDGNILIDHRGVTGPRPGGRFVIIDWPGAALRGFAIVDLVRLARALPLNRRQFRREVIRHCRILGCEICDATSHLLAGMGNILKHREHFPLPLFMATAEDCLAILESIGT